MLEVFFKNGVDVNVLLDCVSYIYLYLLFFIEYFKFNEEEVDFEIVFFFIRYGVKVSFRGMRGMMYVRDLYGILFLVKKFLMKDDIFCLMVDVVFYFDVDVIKNYDLLVLEIKEYLVIFGNRLWDFKYFIRVLIYILFGMCFFSKV